MCSRALVTGPDQSKKRCQRSLPFGRRKTCCGSAHNEEHSQQSFPGLPVQRLRADVSGVVLRRAPLSFEQPVLERVLVPQIPRGQMAGSPATRSVQHGPGRVAVGSHHLPYLCSSPDVFQNLQ